MTRIMHPSSCPVCRMGNYKNNRFTQMMRSWEDLTRIEYQCSFCYSIFWYRYETREACGLESRYPLTRAGWNTHIQHIDPIYEDGDICPRCNADPNYKESFGKTGKCVICDGTGIYKKHTLDLV